MKTKWVVAGLAGIGTVFAISFFIAQSDQETPRSFAQMSSPLPGSTDGKPSAVRDAIAPSAVSSALEASPASPAEWKRFRDRFGASLKGSFTSDGRLVSVRATGVAGSRAYDVRDPQAAIRRAREILDDARSLMGVSDESPLGQPTARVRVDSASVFFKQIYQGLALEPFGNVTVDLGADGELKGLYSTYIPGFQVTNQARLASAEARRAALNSIGGASAVRVSEPQKILWAQSNLGQIAYQVFVDGRQVIISADTGEVLASRDRRQF